MIKICFSITFPLDLTPFQRAKYTRMKTARTQRAKINELSIVRNLKGQNET